MQQSRWSYTHNDPSHNRLQDSPYADSAGDPRAPQEHQGWYLHLVLPVECLWPLSVSPIWQSGLGLPATTLVTPCCLPGSQYVLVPRYFYWQHRLQTLCKLHQRHWSVNPIYPQCQAFNNIKGIKEKISVQTYKIQVNFTVEFTQIADTYRDKFLICMNCEMEPAGIRYVWP